MEYRLYLLILFFAQQLTHAGLDQISNAAPHQADISDFAQTFLPAVEGDLIGVWLYVDSDYAIGSDDKYTISINRFEEGHLGEELTRGTIIEGEIPEEPSWYYVEFEQPYTQKCGEILAIFVRGGAPFGMGGGWLNFGIYGKGLDTYLNGNAYIDASNECHYINNNSTIDFLFATVIDAFTEYPAELTDPAFISIEGRNRFNGRTAVAYSARNLTTGEVTTIYGGFQPSILTGVSGEVWEISVDLDSPVSSPSELTLRETGYTGSDILQQVMPAEGKADITIYYWNDDKRTIPEWDSTILWFKKPPVLWEVNVHDPQPETRYILEYSTELKEWKRADEAEVHSNKSVIKLRPKSSYGLYATDHYWRLRLEEPVSPEVAIP